ncbi:Spectrin alpha chain, non-erythrocytic 1 isoform X3 [Oopsacas minuta]|uniref:Spectrin alpha chain, non-erythrocytic 1 isoform X3 n=1 Tax=Oopsacas minuta TaxID=111878 RepID=A0AAV7K4T8_9METZ|nr:Spectrin alpha chain, non-erythrocytic 1 isoform X3 [Oopsacas minuta]
MIAEYSGNLHSVRVVHEFVRELIDWKEWVKDQKCDISQDHITDIEQALQTHDVFVNEVSINSERIIRFIQKAKCLQLPSNFNSHHLSRGIDELSTEWDELNIFCSLKRETLVNDSASLQYSIELDKIALWFDSAEKMCTSQELGKDIISASIIQKTLRNLEHDFAAHNQRFNSIVLGIYDFFPNDHKCLPSLRNLISSITVRVEEISSLYKQRCIVIDQSCYSYHLLQQIADEQDWVDEKLNLLESCDTVNDLIQAQKVLKKFELLIADFNLRENRIQKLEIELNTITSFPHYSIVNLAFGTLNNQWSHLNVVTKERKKNILGNISIQQFLSDCFEANMWLREIETLISGGAVAKVVLE